MAWIGRSTALITEPVRERLESKPLPEPLVLDFNAYSFDPEPYFVESFKPAHNANGRDIERDSYGWPVLDESVPAYLSPADTTTVSLPNVVVDKVAFAERTLFDISQNKSLNESARVRAAQLILERDDMKRELGKVVDKNRGVRAPTNQRQRIHHD